MRTDPVVDEIHAIREKLSRQYGDNLHAICEGFRNAQKSSHHPAVSFAPKPAKSIAPGDMARVA